MIMYRPNDNIRITTNLILQINMDRQIMRFAFYWKITSVFQMTVSWFHAGFCQMHFLADIMMSKLCQTNPTHLLI